MDFFLVIIFGIIALSFFSGGNKKKKSSYTSSKSNKKSKSALYESSSPATAAMRQSRETSQGGAYKNNNQNQDQHQDGMQDDDFQFGQLYSLSKAKIEKARREAASKLEYEGLPKFDDNDDEDVQSFQTTAKSYVSTKQPPLVRDMNFSRRRHLSSERRSSLLNIKTIIGCVVLFVTLMAFIR